MIRINLHGKLGEDIGESWDLEVSSVAEAFRAIESNTRKFRRWILKYANEYEYEILVDKSSLFSERPDFKSIQEIKNSELFINLDNKIQVIDVVPCIIGGGGVAKIVTGVVAIAAAVVIGVFFPPLIPLAIGIGIAGLGLIAAGTSELLSKPPPNVPFTAQQVNPIGGEGESGGPTSYLFNGPVNTVGEGGPVPVGYGRLLIGGNNVYANYDIIYRAYNASKSTTTNQVVNEIQGDQYTFNSKCYLINQSPLNTLPF
jgi:predicted phage tail protein